jgi:transcriptional regulator with XRE-family HTH domain
MTVRGRRIINNVAALLKERGISDSSFSRRTGVNRLTIGDLRRDKYYPVEGERMLAIAEGFNLPVEKVFRLQHLPIDPEAGWNQIKLAYLANLGKEAGIKLNLEAYSNNCSLTIKPKNTWNRRVDFRINCRIQLDYPEPTLKIIDFGVTSRDNSVSENEKLQVFNRLITMLIQCAAKFNLKIILLTLCSPKIKLDHPNLSFSDIEQQLDINDRDVLEKYKLLFKRYFRVDAEEIEKRKVILNGYMYDIPLKKVLRTDSKRA